MNPTGLLTSLLGGVLGARHKRHDKTLRFLSGAGGSFFNARTLLGAGALGWAAYEIFRSHQGGGAQRATLGSGQVEPGTVVVPSVPPAQAAAAARPTPPPLPEAGAGAVGAAIEPGRRLAGIVLAAARSDGELGEAEYGRILALAREAGAERVVAAELAHPTPLEVLCAGIPHGAVAEELYRLAFGVVRCDEGVNPTERKWLARLAQVLALAPADVERLEREVAQAIQSA